MHSIHSKFSPGRLLDTLKENSNAGLFRWITGKKPINGNFYKKKFNLSMRFDGIHRFKSRDYFCGEIRATLNGSVITGDFKVHPLSKFLAYFFVGSMGLLFAFFVFIYLKYHLFPWPILIVPFLVLVRAVFTAQKWMEGGVASYPPIIEFLNECAGNKNSRSRYFEQEKNYIQQIKSDLTDKS